MSAFKLGSGGKQEYKSTSVDAPQFLPMGDGKGEELTIGEERRCVEEEAR